MKVQVTRASDPYASRPCKEAWQVSAIHLDRRTASTLEEAKRQSWGPDWFSSGTNHREENGKVVREIEDEFGIWITTLDSLENLLDLVKEYGEILILPSEYKGIEYRVEIHDADDF